MKRAGNLFEQVLDRQNLRQATARALRGKRDRRDARQFVDRLDANLGRMKEQLLSDTFAYGNFHQFVIHDPKERIITAPCFEERVLHHAVINVCEPLFERWLIDDTYACRRGRGRIAALARAGHFARRFGFFLKLDIRKYFDSVPHDNLLARLERLFKDRRLLDLFGRIVCSFRRPVECGLPIGSLMSQHFANFYLGWFDRVVKEQWRIKGYVRYMDDMLLWSDSKAQLRGISADARTFLGEQLGLQVKPTPYLNRNRHGVDFLGCRVYRDGVTLNRRSRLRLRRKLLGLERRYLRSEIDEHELQVRGTALVAFTRMPGHSSWRFRRQMLQEMPVSGHKARTG